MVATTLLYAINNGDANASEKIRGQLAKRPLGTDDNVFWTLLAAGADFHALDYHGYSPLNILRNPATEGGIVDESEREEIFRKWKWPA
jgi:hypothetical protein